MIADSVLAPSCRMATAVIPRSIRGSQKGDDSRRHHPVTPAKGQSPLWLGLEEWSRTSSAEPSPPPSTRLSRRTSPRRDTDQLIDARSNSSPAGRGRGARGDRECRDARPGVAAEWDNHEDRHGDALLSPLAALTELGPGIWFNKPIDRISLESS